jgi:23S rRNA (adenine2503-C2)-methyltransferase
MSNLPAALRAQLAEQHPLFVPRVVAKATSNDGTRKYLLELADGARVETVGIPTPGRLTVCFSTQVGCAMGCAFCATGTLGLTRSLAPGEMVDQVNLVARDFGARATNAVAMGQGEPFANYNATLAALRFMNSADGLGVGARHLTVSTCGIISQIRRLAAEPEQFTLAVSLHSAVQATRNKLMPSLAEQPLEQLRSTLDSYGQKTGRRPSLEYALIHKVNDSDAELEALLAFCQGILCHVNLIPLNLVQHSAWQAPPRTRALAFEQALQKAHVEASLRSSRGADIAGACGQLATQQEVG